MSHACHAACTRTGKCIQRLSGCGKSQCCTVGQPSPCHVESTLQRRVARYRACLPMHIKAVKAASQSGRINPGTPPTHDELMCHWHLHRHVAVMVHQDTVCSIQVDSLGRAAHTCLVARKLLNMSAVVRHCAPPWGSPQASAQR